MSAAVVVLRVDRGAENPRSGCQGRHGLLLFRLYIPDAGGVVHLSARSATRAQAGRNDHRFLSRYRRSEALGNFRGECEFRSHPPIQTDGHFSLRRFSRRLGGEVEPRNPGRPRTRLWTTDFVDNGLVFCKSAEGWHALAMFSLGVDYPWTVSYSGAWAGCFGVS
jgi:hypothetical protein